MYNDTLHKQLKKGVKHCFNCNKEVSFYPRYIKSTNTTILVTDLQVHHINGIKQDNNFDNISILCPKCHSNVGHTIIRNNGKFEKKILNDEMLLTVNDFYRSNIIL